MEVRQRRARPSGSNVRAAACIATRGSKKGSTVSVEVVPKWHQGGAVPCLIPRSRNAKQLPPACLSAPCPRAVPSRARARFLKCERVAARESGAQISQVPLGSVLPPRPWGDHTGHLSPREPLSARFGETMAWDGQERRNEASETRPVAAEEWRSGHGRKIDQMPIGRSSLNEREMLLR